MVWGQRAQCVVSCENDQKYFLCWFSGKKSRFIRHEAATDTGTILSLLLPSTKLMFSAVFIFSSSPHKNRSMRKTYMLFDFMARTSVTGDEGSKSRA